MIMQRKYVAALAITLIALAGCSDKTKENLGLIKKSPDEFAVVKRAPLSMPPDYSLRPPAPGEPRPQEQAPDQQAAQTVFGSPTTSSTTPKGDGEAAVLSKVGPIDPNIRSEVDAEQVQYANQNVPVIKKIVNMGAPIDPSQAPAQVVDAPAEAARLKKNQAQGQSPSAGGDTPSIEK